MKVRALRHGTLNVHDWTLEPGVPCCVLGGNASGKSTLAGVFAGAITPAEADIESPPESTAWVSFEATRARYERERREDDSDFTDEVDFGSTGLEILLESGASMELICDLATRFGAGELLSRGCRQFSSGEWRRIELLGAVLLAPELLVLDEPFEALDVESRRSLSEWLGKLADSGQWVLVFAHRQDDVPSWCKRVALLVDGQIKLEGPREELCRQTDLQAANTQAKRKVTLPHSPLRTAVPQPLLLMRQVRVAYSDKVQFANFDWSLESGQHTLIHGPNGCGKSTLLQLISGDHPQCYSNDVQVLGFNRGSGESIWEVKRNLAMVSPALHRDYRVAASVLNVTLSGFFDSIGLYAAPTQEQVHLARAWLRVFDLDALAEAPFGRLSFGEQRLVLVARALVKQPPLLLLDEPTQGLDDSSSLLVLTYLTRLAELERTTVLFVTHREEEHLPWLRHTLRFEPDPRGLARYRIARGRLG